LTVLPASWSSLPVISTDNAGIPKAVLEGVTGVLAEEKAFEIKVRGQFLLTAFSTSTKLTSQTVSNQSFSTSNHQ
jgi:hypothetical protein